ncbi:MAG: quinate 5-dehydrogenase [Anaerolineae bacterium]|nr:quinate 5-dehydrogenase [Anaerolineae bacterium]
MKRAVSISIGSSKRDSAAELELLGERVRLERIGTNGDMERAAQLFGELDGKVDAFGMGGAIRGLTVDDKYYPLHSVDNLTRYVKQTPVVDGTGVKSTLEGRMLAYVESQIGVPQPKRFLITSMTDRWWMAAPFFEGGYECVVGDLMFALGVPIAIHSIKGVKRLAATMLPVIGRLPFEWVYPIGESQEHNTPKFGKYFDWATVIAGDCHYIKRFMPARLDGKIIFTNTTTKEDVQDFRNAGVAYLVTSTPRLEGRSFGTNVMEAMLVAISGKGRALSSEELRDLIDQIGLKPNIEPLNPDSLAVA